jgi:hypothetical protein
VTFDNPLFYSAPLENAEILHQRITDACQTIPDSLGNFEICDSPWTDLSISELIEMKDIWNICCDLWFHKTWELKLLNGERVLELYCQLIAKYYIVKVFVFNVILKLKNTHFGTYVYIKFSSCSCEKLRAEVCPSTLVTPYTEFWQSNGWFGGQIYVYPENI